MKNIVLVGSVLGVSILSFWGGTIYQSATYLERCLDAGGGQNPGDHPLCVIEKLANELRLGPIQLSSKNVVTAFEEKSATGQTQVHLELNPATAAALAGYTTRSIGKEIEVALGGRVLKTIRIAEPVSGTMIVLAATQPEAQNILAAFSN